MIQHLRGARAIFQASPERLCFTRYTSRAGLQELLYSPIREVRPYSSPLRNDNGALKLHCKHGLRLANAAIELSLDGFRSGFLRDYESMNPHTIPKRRRNIHLASIYL